MINQCQHHINIMNFRSKLKIGSKSVPIFNAFIMSSFAKNKWREGNCEEALSLQQNPLNPLQSSKAYVERIVQYMVDVIRYMYLEDFHASINVHLGVAVDLAVHARGDRIHLAKHLHLLHVLLLQQRK